MEKWAQECALDSDLSAISLYFDNNVKKDNDKIDDKTKRHLGVDSHQVVGGHLSILPPERGTFLLINVFIMMVSLIDFNFFLVVVVENV